ncbi:MAG: hypothetical protein R3F60_26650 [bacterium]
MGINGLRNLAVDRVLRFTVLYRHRVNGVFEDDTVEFVAPDGDFNRNGILDSLECLDARVPGGLANVVVLDSASRPVRGGVCQ